MIKILDCTLRDGGYINNSMFGESTINSILSTLVVSNVDIIEVGSLRNEAFFKGRAIYSSVLDFEENVENINNSEFSMFLQLNQYDFKQLEQCCNQIKHIRCAFHRTDIEEGLILCKTVKDKGYNCHINPINILSYSEADLLSLISQVNKIQPNTFTIVDTIGSMTEIQLLKIIDIIKNYLDTSISVGLHLHEHLSLSFALSQKFIEAMKEYRNISVDASLNGIGRLPGNLSLELIISYLNSHHNKNYNFLKIIEEIDKSILPIKQEKPWGYSLPYALSALLKIHRSYVEFLLDKGTLSTSELQKILNLISQEEKSRFNKTYINELYENYIKELH